MRNVQLSPFVNRCPGKFYRGGWEFSSGHSKQDEDRFIVSTRMWTWEDYAVFGFLIDRIGRYQLEEFEGCSYLPLERILPEIVTEELGHIEFGATKTAELAQKSDESKEKIQQRINYWYIRALDMFGHSESRRSERYVYWGLKRRSNEQAREEYIAEVEPLITAMGLEVPDPLQGRHYL